MTARWPRWALAALLLLTAALYLTNLSALGCGNSFYAAAAQAGSRSWTAWFFGSLDAQDFITVDKPPAALWITGLSVRLFGLSSWSVLAPQGLMGVASVGVLYATMRRIFADPGQGAAAGLLAGVVLACTPAAVLMFRLNNPDALLVLLLVVAAYCLTRAVGSASWRWLAAVGVVLGVAFLTKMLQAALVVPGFAAAYLLAATSWRNRLWHLAVAAAAMLVSAGWWVLVVYLTPAAARPYIGGSSDDSVLNLAFGYNGVNRVLGNHPTGAGRLFGAEMGNEISWLLPVALFVVCLGLALARRLPRPEVAALVAWGGWLLVTALVLSFAGGTVLPYYTVVLAPAVAALVALGAIWGWRLLPDAAGRAVLATMIGLGAGWGSILLHRNGFSPTWWIVAAAGSVTCALLLWRPAIRAALALGVVAALAGAAGVAVAGAAAPRHAASWTGDEATNAELADLLEHAHSRWAAATNGSESAAVLELATGTSVMAVGGWSGDPAPTLQQFIDHVHAGDIGFYVEAGAGHTHGRVIRSGGQGVSHTREIADWVAAHYQSEAVGDSLVYRMK